MIRLDAVTKEYRQRGGERVRALSEVRLSIGAGGRVGVVGLNGAGKSTLLRLLLGYVRPTAGVVEVGGLAPRAYVERHGIAYVPERVAIPRHWGVRRALEAYAALGEVGADFSERVDAAIARLGLGELQERRVGQLSKGNLQRLAIAQALLAERDLMVLDEPTDGLDPLWVAELRGIVAEWHAAAPGRTLVFASHNLYEVERVVEEVVVLHRGTVRERFPLAAGGPPLETRFLELVREWEGA